MQVQVLTVTNISHTNGNSDTVTSTTHQMAQLLLVLTVLLLLDPMVLILI